MSRSPYNFIILLILLGCKSDSSDKLKSPVNSPDAAAWLADYREPDIKWGFIDKHGAIVIDIQFDDARDFDHGLAIVNVKGKWGYIDGNGRVLIAPTFLDAHEFKDSIALVQGFDKKYFYINLIGKKLFDCPSENCGDFSDGYAIFNENSAFGIIDRKGRVCSTKPYADLSHLDKGRFVAMEAEKFGIIDHSGNWLAKPVYKAINAASCSLIRCKKEAGYCFLDNSFKETLGPYSEAADFVHDVAIVTKDDNYSLINKKGKVLFQSKNTLKYGGEETWISYEVDKCRFIDSKGKPLFNRFFDNVYQFNEGLAGFQDGGIWGYIDKSGKIVVPPALPIIWDSKEGMIRFIAETRFGFMDNTGKTAIEPKYREARDFKEGMARIAQ